jgi:hypothetical protein
MKFNKAFMPNTPADRQMRANRAWAVDFQVLDLPHRPMVMLVTDFGTRLPLGATVTLPMAEDVVATLERLAWRSKCPDEIWIGHSFRLLETWAGQHGISVSYHSPTPQMKATSERLLRDLGSYFGDKSFASLMELGHDIERWRQSYAARALPPPTPTGKWSIR